VGGWLSRVLALPIRRRSRGDVACVWVGTKWRRGWVICVRLVVVEWVGGADVAPERAVDGGQAVGIIVRRLGLTYPGVTTVTWHREGGTSARKQR